MTAIPNDLIKCPCNDAMSLELFDDVICADTPSVAVKPFITYVKLFSEN